MLSSNVTWEDRNETSLNAEALAEQSCRHYRYVFEQVDHYFRNQPVLPNSQYAPAKLGLFITIAYFVVIIFGACGNFLTVLAVAKYPQMRTTRNYFILNLALSDFFVCIITAPITLYTVLHVFWPFGKVSCKLAGSLQGFGVFLSTFSITAIAYDRYVVIIFPTKRKRQRNLALLLFVLIWLISVVLALPMLIASDIQTIIDECSIQLMICQENDRIWQKMPLGKQSYTLAILITQYALPLISIVFVYTQIWQRMRLRLSVRMPTYWPNRNDAHAQRKYAADRRRRTNLLFGCVVLIFAVAWLPLNVFHVLWTFGLIETFPVPIFAICHLIAMLSSCLNPVSYAFFNSNFKEQFVKMFNSVLRYQQRKKQPNSLKFKNCC
uniref:G_PROTEIN_RECEP_F1_2 domain-containing protein n=1 Tax=Syphacia muris TaxID=451379 RepID=A0A0N5B1C2_9BILA